MFKRNLNIIIIIIILYIRRRKRILYNIWPIHTGTKYQNVTIISWSAPNVIVVIV